MITAIRHFDPAIACYTYCMTSSGGEIPCRLLVGDFSLRRNSLRVRFSEWLRSKWRYCFWFWALYA